MNSLTKNLVLGGLLLALAGSALAELGGSAETVQADQTRMKASQRITAAALYSVHTMQTAAGVTVREYVSTGGIVFAVTWQGPAKPDLQQLLGTYFQTFSDAAAAARGGRSRGPLRVAQPGLVVQSGGHMRAFRGRAYVPDLIPDGVSLDEIQ